MEDSRTKKIELTNIWGTSWCFISIGSNIELLINSVGSIDVDGRRRRCIGRGSLDGALVHQRRMRPPNGRRCPCLMAHALTKDRRRTTGVGFGSRRLSVVLVRHTRSIFFSVGGGYRR